MAWSELHSVMGLASQLPWQLVKSRLPGTRGPQVPLGAHLRSATAPVRRDSPELAQRDSPVLAQRDSPVLERPDSQ